MDEQTFEGTPTYIVKDASSGGKLASMSASSISYTHTYKLILWASMLIGATRTLSAQTSPAHNYVAIPTSNSIQTDLISTVPTGIFAAQNVLATPFSIPSGPDTCGYAGTGACNYYDAFGFSGSGQSITIDTSIPNVSYVYTLMNAYSPSPGQQLATIEFVGSQGATVTFPLVAGANIRDYYHGGLANTLNNGISGVVAINAFTCDDPKSCLGSGQLETLTLALQEPMSLTSRRSFWAPNSPPRISFRS